MSALATDHTGPGSLSSMLGFDTPAIRVHDDGSVTPEPGVHAPEVYHDDETAPIGWEWASRGYTGQYGYSGPVMHASEQLTGRLATDILARPGVYVAVVVESLGDDDDSPAGWAILRQVPCSHSVTEIRHNSATGATREACYSCGATLRFI